MDTAEECAESCLNYDDCGGYSYEGYTKNCILKKRDIRVQRRKADDTSGIRCSIDPYCYDGNLNTQ